MQKEPQNFQKIPGEALLLFTALIWGTGFVAQRMAMDGMKPLGFVGVRFLLGCLVLLPMLIHQIWFGKKARLDPEKNRQRLRSSFLPSLICGSFLFLGTTFQQIGILSTTAAKAGFITSLYLVLVPLLGIFMGKRVNRWVWIGVVLALAGVYFLSFDQVDFHLRKGDFFLLLGAFFWAFQILALDYYSSVTDNLYLAFGQFAVTAALGLLGAGLAEKSPLIQNSSAILPLLYSGFIAVGVAFTLQVFGQRRVNPSLASLIMGLEAVFATLGGMVFLKERLEPREWLGCAIMLAAVLLVQLKGQQKKQIEDQNPSSDPV